MTEREKIAQIIAEHLCPQGKAHKTLYGAERRCYSRDNFAECEKVGKCVDALIAAGLRFGESHTVKDVFERIIEKTEAVQASGYDGLGVEDIKQLAKEEYGVE